MNWNDEVPEVDYESNGSAYCMSGMHIKIRYFEGWSPFGTQRKETPVTVVTKATVKDELDDGSKIVWVELNKCISWGNGTQYPASCITLLLTPDGEIQYKDFYHKEWTRWLHHEPKWEQVET